jgi:hypothetical protein
MSSILRRGYEGRGGIRNGRIGNGAEWKSGTKKKSSGGPQGLLDDFLDGGVLTGPDGLKPELRTQNRLKPVLQYEELETDLVAVQQGDFTGSDEYAPVP